ncbi:Muskelin N-terminus-domain-containing protein, partial [Blyttiomyces helicus]
MGLSEGNGEGGRWGMGDSDASGHVAGGQASQGGTNGPSDYLSPLVAVEVGRAVECWVGGGPGGQELHPFPTPSFSSVASSPSSPPNSYPVPPKGPAKRPRLPFNPPLIGLSSNKSTPTPPPTPMNAFLEGTPTTAPAPTAGGGAQTPPSGINPAPATSPKRSALPKLPATRLKYDVQSWSSHSASYHPRNIMANKPQDQSSRWSSGSNNQMQFITVKFERLSVVHTITFGKYHKVHVCNLKEFKVFGGLTPTNMIELLHSGLRNDSEPETFSLKHKANDVIFPCQYIKIVPLLAWGANFNFSIWYVELRGISNPEYVEKTRCEYINYRENEVIRLCLKHFRQRNYLDTFDCLHRRTQLQLEDPLLTDLHRTLVLEGDFAMAEDLITEAAERNLFQDYISECTYRPVWKRILPSDSVELNPEPAESETPCMRGGHQMCIDSTAGKIYLFGGWDGARDLSDFWCFDETERRWTCISMDTRRQNGPGPRSCHKICFDSKMRQIYTLGRYVDPDSRPNVNLECDFWRFDVVLGTWTRISANTP